MLKYEALNKLSEVQFRRFTGVKKTTFKRMVEILKEAKQAQKQYRGGRTPKLSVEDSLLMTLEYLREYRTYFHTAQGYDLSESNAYKIIRFVEDTLVKHKDFALPGRKALLNANPEDVLLIDATESPVERPKKKSEAILFG